MSTATCLNRGCGLPFDPASSEPTQCDHHPGAPVFHEGLKGWSCCTKRVIDFDAFLKIPGCTSGHHSIHPPKTPAPAAEPTGAAKTTVSAAESNPTSASGASATLASKAVNGVETFTTASVLSAAAPAAKAAPPVSVVREQDLHDLADAVISPGTICKRKTCGKEYYDVSSRSDECIHHPGVPVFHEGSKGWTCCSRRVLEFDLFLKIQGCTTAKHRFTDIQVDSTESTASRTIECRRDWYQTPDTIILSVFAKKMDKEATTVVFEDSHLKVDIKFLDGSTSQYHTSLFQPIDPALSKFQILSTKLEIVMKKANGISWVSIEPKENVTSWTTFGITGSVGTVGGKEAIIGNDAPLHLLSKSE